MIDVYLQAVVLTMIAVMEVGYGRLRCREARLEVKEKKEQEDIAVFTPTPSITSNKQPCSALA